MKFMNMVVLMAGCFAGSAALASIHISMPVAILFPGDTTRDCVFFTLSGVTQADPASPSSPWFAIPRSHPNFKEQYALLLAARLSGTPVDVETTGTLLGGCGSHVEVKWVEFGAP